jgi:uncharacterized protein (DUF427 family)
VCRQSASSRHLVVKLDDQVIADTARPVVLFESGPRWYVPRDDIDENALTPAEEQTFCPCMGLASYYDIASRKKATWSHPQAWPEVARVSNLLVRTGQDRCLPGRQETRSRAGSERRAARDRPRLGSWRNASDNVARLRN